MTDQPTARARATSMPSDQRWSPATDRYDVMPYQRSGVSGLDLPRVSLGLWQGFSGEAPLERSRAILRRAVALGVTHLDLANNYGPPYGSAETTFGEVMASDAPLAPLADDV